MPPLNQQQDTTHTARSSNNSRIFNYAGFAFAMFIILLNIFYTWRSLKDYEDNTYWVVHTYEVLSEAENVFSLIKDGQRTQRGYILTQNQKHQQKYIQSEKEIFQSIDHLQQLTADQPVQQQRIDSLKILVNNSFSFWRQCMKLRDQQGLEASAQLVASGEGVNLVENIGLLITSFKAFEKTLLEQRQQQFEESSQRTSLLSITGGFISVLLLLFSFIQLRQRLAHEKRFNELLEQKVQERTKAIERMQAEIFQAKINEQFIYTASLMEGQELERKRLGRELHDGLGQMLNVLKMRLVMEGTSPEMRQYFDQVITEVIRINNNLMPLLLEDFGLEAAVKQLVEQYRQLTPAEIDFDTDLDNVRFQPAFEVSMYRIIQEALSNAVKYAGASYISIQISLQDNKLLIMVEDNGKGFSPEPIKQQNKGHGLLNMQYRVEALQGEIVIDSQPGKGSVINILVPIQHKLYDPSNAGQDYNHTGR